MQNIANHKSAPAWRALLWGSIPVLLLVPAIAMVFTEEVQWEPQDFVAAAALFGIIALTVDFVMRHVTAPLARLALVGLVLLALMLVWAELAVGVFGTSLAGS